MSLPDSIITAPSTTRRHGRYSLESVAVWAIIATLVLAIGLVIPMLPVSAAATKTFILAVGALVVLALYVLARLSQGNVVLPPLFLVGALWLPVLAYTLSALFAGVSFTTALWGLALESDTLGVMLLVACLGTLTAFVLRRPEQYALLLRAGALVFGIVVVLEALSVLIGQFAPHIVSPALSLLGSYEDLAFFLGLGVIGTLVTFRFIEISRTTRRALTFATVGALIFLAIANSAFVWTTLALAAFGLLIETMMMRTKDAEDDLGDVALMDEASLEVNEGTRSIVVPFLVLFVSLFFLVGGTLGIALAEALNINTFSVSPSWQSTLSIAQETYRVSPVFGTGPGTFGIEWLKYRDTSLNTGPFWSTDFSSGISTVATSLVTTGLVGTLAWILFLGLFVVSGLRMLILRTPSQDFVRYVAVFSFVATVYLFAASLFRLPGITILALAFVCAGLFASTMRYAISGQQWGIIFSRSPRLGFIIVFLLTLLLPASAVVAYNLTGRYVALVQLARAGEAFAAGDLSQAEQSVQRSIALAPSAMAYQAQANIALTQLGQIVASTTMPVARAQEAFQASLSTGINAALTATRLAPQEYRNWLTLGNLYAQAVPLNVSGAYESAKTAYEKAKALHPTSPAILYVLAQLNIAHKDTTAAGEHLKAAIALKPDYITAIFLLSQLEVQNGNLKEALASAESAAYFAPNDPNVLFQVGVLRAAGGDLTGAVKALTAAVAANAQFANARYFLAAIHAKQGNYEGAIAELDAIADLSAENARTVAPLIATLQTQKNPFPTNLLSVSPAPVQ